MREPPGPSDLAEVITSTVWDAINVIPGAGIPAARDAGARAGVTDADE